MDIGISKFSAMDKKRAVLAVVAAVVCLVIGYWVLGRYSSASRLSSAKRAELVKFRSLEEDYLKKKALIETKARKAYASDPAESTVAAIERIGASAGVKESLRALKPLEEKESAGYTESGVEVKLERVDLNRLVNLLYLIENNRGLFVIKEFSMKARFEDANLFDVSMKVVRLVKQKG